MEKIKLHRLYIFPSFSLSRLSPLTLASTSNFWIVYNVIILQKKKVKINRCSKQIQFFLRKKLEKYSVRMLIHTATRKVMTAFVNTFLPLMPSTKQLKLLAHNLNVIDNFYFVPFQSST